MDLRKLSIEIKILIIILGPWVILAISAFILSLGKPLGLYDWFNS